MLSSCQGQMSSSENNVLDEENDSCALYDNNRKYVDFATSDLVGYDLSYSVINPDSFVTDEMYSWWTDDYLESNKEWLENADDHWCQRPEPLGYRGDHYQRFYIHYETVTRKDSLHYYVKGKTRCKDEILPFDGIITIESKLEADTAWLNELHYMKDITDVGFIKGSYNYTVYQQNSQTRKAKLFGIVTYQYLVHAGKIYYDGTDLVADSYENNQYVGKWIDEATHDTLTCNWGDFRIPNSDGLDIGAGEFSPSDSARVYYGWDDYLEMYDASLSPWWK